MSVKVVLKVLSSVVSAYGYLHPDSRLYKRVGVTSSPTDGQTLSSYLELFAYRANSFSSSIRDPDLQLKNILFDNLMSLN